MAGRRESSGEEMPRYTFKLRDNDVGVEDHDGVNLPDAEIAYRYACDVVRELMSRREPSTRSWQLEVYEGDHERIFEIPFMRLDQTLDHLNAQTREMIEDGARQVRSLKDTYRAAKVTIRETRSLVARSRGKTPTSPNRFEHPRRYAKREIAHPLGTDGTNRRGATDDRRISGITRSS